MAGVPERLGTLETRMNRVEEGVANFKSFQIDARDFFARADERARTEEAFHNRRDQEIKDAFNLRHQENVAKLSEIGAGLNKKTLIWNIAGVVVGITAIVVAVCIAIMTARSAHLTDLRKLFVEGNHPQVYAVSNLPNMR